MNRLSLLLTVILSAACFPVVPMQNGKLGEVDGDTGGLSNEVDADGDGVPASSDCDDEDASVFPGAPESCDGVDNDCDGMVDPDTSSDATLWYADVDADGYGDVSTAAPSCTAPAGRVADSSDCDDNDASIHPDAPEVCDNRDNDCDLLVDDDDPSIDPSSQFTFFADTDGDGFGDADAALLSCAAPSGFVDVPGDCADADAAIHPDAQEVCDDFDNDCDGQIDAADDSLDASTFRDFYLDADADGHGAGAVATSACSTPAGLSAIADDCNDADATVHPEAQEVCDAADIDEDCDGLTDDADASVDVSTQTAWTIDQDGDGYGDVSAAALSACDNPSTGSDVYVQDATDCDDSLASVNPGATEVCDEADIDEDCDGLSDDADGSVDTDTFLAWAPDQDGDGYGDATATLVRQCADPSTVATPYVADATDCDDNEVTVHPGAQEVCDDADVDEDCDGLSDDLDPSVDASGGTLWFADADRDGYGDSADPGKLLCDVPLSGYTSTADDCDDTDAAVHPGATEVCSAADDDCDPSTSDAGLARFVDTSGVETDLSADLSSGTAGSPATWTSSADGDMYVCEGTWYVALEIDGHSVSIQGPHGSALTVLDGADADSVLFVAANSDVTLQGLTLTHGFADNGGAIWMDSAGLTADDVVLQDNIANNRGGALYALDSNVSFTNSLWSGNVANDGAAAYIDGQRFPAGHSLHTCTFDANETDNNGGALYVTGDASVDATDSSFQNNISGSNGGAAYVSSGSLDLLTCTVDGNLADGDGGGVYSRDVMDIEDTVFTSNIAAERGGGLYLDLNRNEDVTITGTLDPVTGASSSAVSGNAVGERGTGIYIVIDDNRPSGTLTVSDVDFSTDDVRYVTDRTGTLSPGDAASFACDHANGCR